MIRLRWIILAILILSLSVTSCFAADPAPQKHQVGTILAQRGGGGNPDFNHYAVMGAGYDTEESGWVYTVLRVYPYPSGGWYALSGAQPTEQNELGMHYDSGYSWHETGDSINVNAIPREPAIIKFPALKYQQDDIVQMKGGEYSVIYWTESSDEFEGVYYSGEIRKKADGTWGYVLGDRYQSLNFWDYQRGFEASVTQLVTHLPNRDGIEVVDKFPTVVPITTVAPVITTLKPIPIDPPTGVSTLPPTPIRTEGPSSNPFYPVTTPTPVTVQPVSPVSVQPSLPVPVAPVAPLPTAQPTFGFGKRYAVGNPGSFLGTRFGSGDTSTVTRGSRTITGSDTVLKPGSRSYGLTPPKGQFVRWYPAARWATGIK